MKICAAIYELHRCRAWQSRGQVDAALYHCTRLFSSLCSSQISIIDIEIWADTNCPMRVMQNAHWGDASCLVFCEPSPRTGLFHAVITSEESKDIEIGKKGRSTKAVSQTAATKKGSKAAGRGKTGQSPEGAVPTKAQKGTSESSSETELQAAANLDAEAAHSGEQQGSKNVSKAKAVKTGSKAGVQSTLQNSLVKAVSARDKNQNDVGVLNKAKTAATTCSRLRTARGSENISLAANSP